MFAVEFQVPANSCVNDGRYSIGYVCSTDKRRTQNMGRVKARQVKYQSLPTDSGSITMDEVV